MGSQFRPGFPLYDLKGVGQSAESHVKAFSKISGTYLIGIHNPHELSKFVAHLQGSGLNSIPRNNPRRLIDFKEGFSVNSTKVIFQNHVCYENEICKVTLKLESENRWKSNYSSDYSPDWDFSGDKTPRFGRAGDMEFNYVFHGPCRVSIEAVSLKWGSEASFTNKNLFYSAFPYRSVEKSFIPFGMTRLGLLVFRQQQLNPDIPPLDEDFF